MADRPLLTIVLAAGKGTRMKSARPKVLHEIAGRSMLEHVLALAAATGSARTAVVVGPGMDDVAAVARRAAPGAEIFVQQAQLGTADAVKAALPAIREHRGDVIVLYGDTPLTPPETIARVRWSLDGGAAVVVLGFEPDDAAEYGRLITDAGGGLLAIREFKDASPTERAVRLCNSGVLAFRVEDLASVLESIGNDNAKGEYYLTDAVEIVRAGGGHAAVVTCDEADVLGINARDQLAAAEAIWQQRRRTRAMREGATLIAPETVWFSHDTQIGRDVLIEPNVFFGPGVTVEDDAVIRANCHIEGARIGKGGRIGPFARLRPGAELGADVHIGNFVEVKNASLGVGAKANHLSYLGDGSVGAGANIGAGTI
ncbi:MAG: bifunctional UDP-N-acetylglucosamine diphosphorylase/glucosamine-1-phosphate N-acetyltransferase GlmU, partial [Hyphomicrobiaceae bacterium]